MATRAAAFGWAGRRGAGAPGVESYAARGRPANPSPAATAASLVPVRHVRYGVVMDVVEGPVAGRVDAAPGRRGGPPDADPSGGRVQLWHVFLDDPSGGVAGAWEVLADGERRRAAGIASPRVRRRWIVGRAAVRRLLAPYAGVAPERLAMRRDRLGRPFLGGRELGAGPAPIRFGVSHSGDLLLLAVGEGPDLGVDVEIVRPLPAAEALAKRLLSPAERRALEALPPADRPRALLGAWVRAEAYLKALGVGWGVVSAGDGSGASRGWRRLPETDPPARGGWSVWEVEPAPGYVAAVAARPGGRLVRRAWGTAA